MRNMDGETDRVILIYHLKPCLQVYKYAVGIRMIKGEHIYLFNSELSISNQSTFATSHPIWQNSDPSIPTTSRSYK